MQPTRDGRRYSLTFDHKPTKSDIEHALMDAIIRDRQSKGIDMTFQQACDRYNSSKKNVLSATTYREYYGIPKRLSKWLLDKKIGDITQNDIDRQINELALNRKPKTVRNYHGYISAVLGTFRPGLNISTTLPQKSKNDPYIPTDEDVKKILTISKGTEYEIPLVLMCYGMRRSEVCAITADDVEDDVLHITKAKVFNADKQWIIQNRNKSTASTRDIVIPKHIAEIIIERGYAYNGNPNNITDYLTRTEKLLGIPHFSAHKLRHYFASKMSALGIPEADILDLGGWETDHVMKAVYRHSMQKEAQKRRISAQLGKELFS